MTDTLKRYSHWCNYDDGSGPAEADGDPDGDWVKYSDAIAVRDAAVAAEREKWQAALAELYWASDANYCDGDEARESFARLEAAQDAVVALLGGAGPAMAGARATAQTLIAAPVLFRHGLRRSDG